MQTATWLEGKPSRVNLLVHMSIPEALCKTTNQVVIEVGTLLVFHGGGMVKTPEINLAHVTKSDFRDAPRITIGSGVQARSWKS